MHAQILQPLQPLRPRRLAEQAERDVLAVERGHGGHAQGDGRAVEFRVDVAVLRGAALGDVELRQHLDVRDELGGGLGRLATVGHQAAIHAQADARAALVGRDVDVAGAPRESAPEHVGEQFLRAVERAVERRVGVILAECGGEGLGVAWLRVTHGAPFQRAFHAVAQGEVRGIGHTDGHRTIGRDGHGERAKPARQPRRE